MTTILSMKDMPKEFKILLLQKLGYNSDGKYVLDNKGNVFKDRYTNDSVHVDNMAIFPGSTIILDNNSLSISSFLEEFGDVL